MGNFINNFLDEAIKNKKEKNKFGKQLDNSLSKKDKTQIINKEKNTTKNLDKLKKNMTEKKDKNQIKIEKNKYSKAILWIIIQIILGISLIAISYSYLQKHEAEKKFFDSSVQYWKNIGAILYSKLGNKFNEQVDKEYIEKRGKLVETLNKLDGVIKPCISKEKDKTTLNTLKTTKIDIDRLKYLLSTPSELSLEKFIQKYQYYSLWVNSLKEGVEQYCNK